MLCINRIEIREMRDIRLDVGSGENMFLSVASTTGSGSGSQALDWYILQALDADGLSLALRARRTTTDTFLRSNQSRLWALLVVVKEATLDHGVFGRCQGPCVKRGADSCLILSVRRVFGEFEECTCA